VELLPNSREPLGPHKWGQDNAIVFGLYAALILLSAALYAVPVIWSSYIGTAYIIIYGLMMLCSLLVWKRAEASPKHILLVSFLIILLLLPMQALTSNDAERYLWDGAVLAAGFDPYVTAPDNIAVTELRELWPTPPEHAAYPTLYPPGALALFGLSALAGPTYGFWIWKLLASLALGFSVVLAYDLLKRRQALQHFALVALSPLLLLETGAAAHLDIFSVLGITAALWCLEKEKIIMAGLIIGLAASIKFLPAVIAGPLLFYVVPRKAVKLFLSASLTWVLIYAAMFGLGYKPLGLLPTFFEKWEGGAPLYPILTSLKETFKFSDVIFLGMLGSLAIIGFGVTALLAKKRYIYAAIILALAVPLLLSPILFPWYLMVFVPLIALRPNATLIIAVTLAPLSYFVLNKWLSQGLWEPAAWTSYVLLLGIILGLIIDLGFTRQLTH